ncbi:hypothetical protein H5410_035626 [Solanum commersonii]|uniref:Uncharacterized protein n=1 Tax=Solanum commersonii TaxID=4109 RepID=A0A9J5Y360_SOLCO|nr:hypothetical protein H5410_035626 [Solanum commersonii]
MQQTWLPDVGSFDGNLFWTQPRELCEVYAKCGPFGVCDKANATCNCLSGFKERSDTEWNYNFNSGGCVRDQKVQCNAITEDKYIGNASQCRSACFNDCSCDAYTYDGSSTCLIWTGDLFNLQQLSTTESERTIFVKRGSPETQTKAKKSMKLKAILSSISALMFLFIGSISYIYYRRRMAKKAGHSQSDRSKGTQGAHKSHWHKAEGEAKVLMNENSDEAIDVPYFHLETILAATDNFSNANKLGQGGFGPVYKGIFPGEKEIAVKTYMTPEYALDGLFSIKSDVFSFGVVVLEIISGRRNTGFYLSEEALNLLGYAWKLWTEKTEIQLIEKSLLESCNRSEAIKCIHVALLCVQENPNHRPNMSDVIVMLRGEAINLPTPNRPAFVTRTHTSITSSSSPDKNYIVSNNQMTITVEEGSTNTGASELNLLFKEGGETCFCTAYTYDGSGTCSIWTGDLFNLQQLSTTESERTIFVKRGSPEAQTKAKKSKKLKAILSSISALMFLLISSISYIYYRRRMAKKADSSKGTQGAHKSHWHKAEGEAKVLMNENSDEVVDVPYFHLETILAATDNFSIANKLGQGGFGPVYKGIFAGEKEIAVKRLSSQSGQGIDEFKNEVTLIAKLQHRNLVRLLGYCINATEQI